MATSDTHISKRVKPITDVDARPKGFAVIVERQIGFVELNENAYGVSPVTAALGIVAEHIETKPPTDGHAYAGHDMSFRFDFDGQHYKIDVEVR